MNYRKIARKRWPHHCWIEGNGRFAVVAYCRVTSVSLWQDHEKAAETLAYITDGACGGMCVRNHELVDLDLVGVRR